MGKSRHRPNSRFTGQPMNLELAFRISNPCDECYGAGEIEVQRAADAYRAIQCEWCDGDGETIDQVYGYESAADAAADYPRAIKIEEVKSD